MGCCVSSAKKKDNEPRHSLEKLPPTSPKRTHVGSRATPPEPPLPFEEETVKEILSETPAAQKKKPSIAEEIEVVAVARKLQEDEAGMKVLIGKLEEVSELVSEYSEMCSASLSTTTTATAATEKRDNEVISRDSRDLVKRQRVVETNRSPLKAPRKPPNVGDLSAGRERRGSKPLSHSPSRIPGGGPRSSARSRRNLSSELKPSQQEAVRCPQRRRQSTSPAETRPNRGVMGRKTVKELKVSNAAGRSLEYVAAEDSGRKSEETPIVQPEQGNEDLDSPNVSLECFIFL